MSKSINAISCLFLDGHGGSIVAKYASKHLHKFIIQRPEFPSDIPEALRQVSDYQTSTLDLSTSELFAQSLGYFFKLVMSTDFSGLSRMRHGDVQ